MILSAKYGGCPIEKTTPTEEAMMNATPVANKTNCLTEDILMFAAFNDHVN